VKEKIGEIARGQYESIWVSLVEDRGETAIELRTYTIPSQGGTEWIPGRESITVPANALPDLLQLLIRTDRRLVQLGEPSLRVKKEAIPVSVRSASPPGSRDARRHPRVLLRLDVECRPMPSATAKPGAPVAGEAVDISLGGAQVWLPIRLPRYSFAELSALISGESFAARGEIVSVAALPKMIGGKPTYRHGLRWLTLARATKDVLSRALSSS
jgi:hypothetical protein